jgi:hypothetical protein
MKKISYVLSRRVFSSREGKAEPAAEKAAKAPTESVQKKQSELLKAVQQKKVPV